MKKIVGLIGLIILAIQPLFAQTIFWEEDFFDSIPGWTLENYWLQIPGKLNFNGSSIPYNFDYAATSSIIEVESDAYQLVINQYIEASDFDADDGIAEVSVLAGSNSYLLWNHELADGDGAGIQELTWSSISVILLARTFSSGFAHSGILG